MGGGDLGGMGGAQLPFTFPALASTNSGNASGQARLPSLSPSVCLLADRNTA